MRKFFYLIGLLGLSSSVFATQNYCLNHIKDHLYLNSISPKQYELDLTNCQLQDSDMTDLNVVFKTYAINILTLDQNKISEKGISVLSNLNDVGAMSIDDNPIGDNGAKLLISKTPKLDQLSLNRAKITDQSIPLLAQSNIEMLHLAGNQIINAGPLVDKVALDLNLNPLSHDSLLQLSQSNSLLMLYITGSHLDETILNNLKNNQNIFDLDVSQTNLGDAGITILSDNVNLTYLHAEKDQISDIGVQQGLSKMTQLNGLFVSENNISSVGIKALPYDHLNILDLSNNHLGDAGVQAVKLDKITQFLYLDNNQIQSKDSATYIAKNLPSDTGLSINNNKLGESGVTELTRRSYNSLQIDSNNIGDAGALMVAQNVKYVISMANNGITDKGVLAFEPLLNSKLFYLDVRNNQITGIGKQALENHQPPIQYLHVDDDAFSAKNFFQYGKKFTKLQKKII